jgi:DNA-binding response OmpR family regulator
MCRATGHEVPSSPIRVLIAEQDSDVREIVAMELSYAGYTVFMAETGLSALTVIETDRPDLVVLDAALPEMSGIEVLRWLRSNEETRRMGAVLIVEMTLRRDVTAALTAGADDCVGKPFSLVDLLHRIDRVVVDARR